MSAQSGERLKRFGYPKSARILKRRQFLALSDRTVKPAFKLNLDAFLVLGRPNDSGRSRLGITVTKKVGPAVTRNRLKRKIREFFRLNSANWPSGMDYLFIARHSAGGLTSARLKADLNQAALKLSKLRSNPPAEKRDGSGPEAQSVGPAPAATTAQPVNPLKAVLEFIQSVLADLALGLIFLYQRFISPLFPPACRFRPTCSSYAAQAIKIHGFWRGSFLAAKRLLKCHPLHPGGDDPVPPRR